VTALQSISKTLSIVLSKFFLQESIRLDIELHRLEKCLLVDSRYGESAMYSCFRWQIFVVIWNTGWKIGFLYSLNQELRKLF